MSKKALFIIPPTNFNEDELNLPKDILLAGGIDVTISSTIIGEITGDNGGRATSTAIFSELNLKDYDAVAVIGGSGTIPHLWEDKTLNELLKEAHKENILVSGICAGSVVVAKTGLLSGRTGTCHSVELMINELKANNVTYLDEKVVAHNDIVTSNNPTGAVDFGKALLNILS